MTSQWLQDEYFVNVESKTIDVVHQKIYVKPDVFKRLQNEHSLVWSDELPKKGIMNQVMTYEVSV